MAKLTVAGIQMGPYPGAYRANMEKAVEALERAVNVCQPDFVCFSEMMTGPYFCRIYDDSYFRFAESIPGPTTETLAAEARRHRVNVIGTVFEEDSGSYYNSAILLSRDGKLAGKYRKTHVPKSSSPLMNSDEKYYFRPGNELPVFHVDDITMGILICFDRSFPETFRTLALKGAELVFVPVASWGLRADSFQSELQVRAVENQLFIVAVNKAGFEQVENEDEGRAHFGRSCIIDPMGEIEASVQAEAWGLVSATIDMDKRKLMRETLVDWLAERRPELYGPITEKKQG